MTSRCDRLTTEGCNPASENIDRCSTEEALRIMSAEDAVVVPAVAAEIPRIAEAVDAIVAAMQCGGRLFYIGAGTSGRLAIADAVECGPTFNCPPGEVQAIIAGGPRAFVHPVETDEDNAEKGAADLEARGFTPRDMLVGITSSGRTPYVLGAVAAARRLGARTIGICCNPGAPLAVMVNIAIVPVVGPEVLVGSTRLKAGTATKLVLNMLSTIVMVQRGFVFGNLMVNVQPTNSKLLSRARMIVAQAAGVDADTASALLERADGSIKVAVLMARLGIDVMEAQQRLECAGGRLRAALGE